jgi:hypothetical protein
MPDDTAEPLPNDTDQPDDTAAPITRFAGDFAFLGSPQKTEKIVR